MQVGSTTYNGSGRRDVRFKPVRPLAETGNGGQSTDFFAIALEQAVQRLASLTTGQNSTQVSFNLSSGTLFTDINVAGFAGRIAGSCQANMSHATVKDLMFIGYYDAPSSSVRVQLVSFKMQCAAASSTGGFITIN
jgi:hypothetical protein